MPTTSTNPGRNTWTALVGQGGELRQRLETMRLRFPMLTAKGGMFPRAAAFRGAAATFSEAAALLGVRAVAPYCAPYLEILEEAIGEIQPAPAHTLTMDGVIWFVHVARCAGQALPEAAVALAGSWIPLLSSHPEWLDPALRHSLAYFAAPYGFDHLVPELIRGIDDPYPVAMLAGGSAAWSAFVREFPRRLALRAVEWPFLFAAASVALVRGESLAIADVAAETHKRIMQEIAHGH
jgi:hypothetical protein